MAKADLKTALTDYLNALSVAEATLIRWQSNVGTMAVLGLATCEDLVAYNAYAMRVYYEEVGVLNWTRANAGADAVGQAILRLLPVEPREPVYYGYNKTIVNGKTVIDLAACQGAPKALVDPRQLRQFGTPAFAPCPQSDGDGATLQAPGPLAVLCLEGPFALLGCAVLAAIALHSSQWFLSSTFSSIAATWSSGARNLKIAEKNAAIMSKRAAYIASCARQALASGLTGAQLQAARDLCATRAAQTFPLVPYEKSIFVEALPLVALGTLFGVVYLLTRKGAAASTTVVNTAEKPASRRSSWRDRWRARRAKHAAAA